MRLKRAPSLLAAVVLVVLVVLSVVAFGVIHRGVERQDQALLKERVGEVLLRLQQTLGRTSSLLGSVGVGSTVFDANAKVLRSRSDITVVLVTKGKADADGNVTRGWPRVSLAVGPAVRPGEFLNRQLARIVLTARPTLSASPVINVAGNSNVVFSIVPPAIGLPGYVALDMVPVFPGRPVSTSGPYRKLDLALYATPDPRPAQLIASTIGRQSLPQPRASAELRFDSIRWGVVGAANASLLDGTAEAAPWIVLGLGLALAFGMAITVETLKSRQRAQHAVTETLQAAMLGPVEQELPYGVAARYQPAVHPLKVGGDWYDVVKLEGGRLGLIVGDCVGHGVEAAAVMGQLRSVSHSLMIQGKTPAEVLADLDSFALRAPGAYCTTVFCALVDPAAMTISYSSAGHPPAIVAAHGEVTEQLKDATSAPLAVASVDPREANTTLRPGCTLVLYTDGLVERRGQSLDDGFHHLEQIIEDNRNQTVESLASTVMDEMRAAQSEDDVALLIYRPPLVPSPQFDATIPADAAELSGLRHQLSGWLDDSGYTNDPEGVVVSVSEACSNAIEHAYAFDPEGLIDVHAQIADYWLTVTVSDSGQWTIPRQNDSERGHGLKVIGAFMDDYTIDTTATGTTIHLRKAIRPTVKPQQSPTAETA